MINEQTEGVVLAEQAPRLERQEDGRLRLSWSRETTGMQVNIFWSAQPHWDESACHLIAEAEGMSEWIFDDPQPETRNYYFVQIDHEVLLPVAERVIPFQNVPNFRDMGGYAAANGRRVRWGKLYRSAELSRMTERDIRYAQSLGVAWICDLRTDDEIGRHPSPRIGAEINEQLSFLASADPREMFAAGITADMLADANRQMVGNTELTARFMRRLLAFQGAPVLFHCATGKDRTGFIGSVVLQALGVSRDDILNDYALTNRFAGHFKANIAQPSSYESLMAGLSEDVLAALSEARPAYMQAAFDELDGKYGSFEAYWISGLGLSREELAQLRDYYLA